MNVRAAWWVFFLGGFLATLAQSLMTSGPARGAFYAVIAPAAVVAVLVGVRMHRPSDRVPWYLVATAIGLWATGDALFVVVEMSGADPFPSIANVVYLMPYPLLSVALHRMSRARYGRDATPVIDALVVAATTAFVMWTLVADPVWTESGGLVGRVLGVTHPALDLMLFAQLAHVALSMGRTNRALRLVGGALLVRLVADLLFMAEPYTSWLAGNGHYIEPVFLGVYVLLATAALHPTMVDLVAVESGRSRRRTLSRKQLAFLCLMVLTLPGTTLVEVVQGAEVHLVEVALTGIVIIAFVFARLLVMTNRMNDQAERLAMLADADVLTGLPNRRRFLRSVDDRLALPAATAPVLLVVLDRYAEINDTLGARVGDALLCAVARRLTDHLGGTATVGRVSGDSFGVLLRGDGRAADAAAGRIRELLAEPLALGDVTVSVDTVVGMAVGPDDAADAEELFQRADVALSVARSRPGQVARYSERMGAAAALTPRLMTELPAAIDSGQIVVHYQPQVDLATGRVRGVEALVRWQHPEHGLVPPASFIPAAERTGLIRPLTLHVLDRTLAQFSDWRAAGLDLHVAVNLSVRNLLDPGFVEDVRAALERYGVTEAALDLEITETMAMVDPNRSMEVLGALEALGVVLSVDDYGTGYSSLAYLQRLPVGRLKIDRSFVMGLTRDEASAVIVRSTVELARHLGLNVVAEGVEDDATMLALRDMHCDAAQGFGLGRPVPAGEVPALVAHIEERLPRVLGLGVPAQA